MIFVFGVVWSIIVLLTGYSYVYLNKPVESFWYFLWIVNWVVLFLPITYRISFGG